MSSVVNDGKDRDKNQPAKKAGISAQTIVIGLLVLGVVILIGFQMFGCESCYAANR